MCEKFYTLSSQNIVVGNLAQIFIGFFLFFLPVVLSTFNYAYYKKKYGSFWAWPTLKMDKEDFLESLIPTWKRMFVYFLSGVSSILLIQAITGQV
jgi:hypothetical protein